MIRRLAVALGLLASSPAFAGGIGLVLTGGATNNTLYFYDRSNDYAQFAQAQTIPNFGGGLEFILGDRDDKITGVFRGFYMQDSPQQNPANGKTFGVAPEDIVSNWREKPRHIGAGTFGISWGILGSPDKAQLTIISAAGSGFLTTDHTEFFMLQAGVGGTFRVTPAVQAFVDVEYGIRWHKEITYGPTGYAGLRYLFD